MIDRPKTAEDIWLENYKLDEAALDMLKDACIQERRITDAYLQQYDKVVKLINDPTYGHFFMRWYVSFRNEYHPYALMGARMVEQFGYRSSELQRMEAQWRKRS